MVIFPEGGRSPDGWGQPFRGGAAYLAIRCGVPVVPVHIEGTGRILPQGRQAPPARAGRVVTFGAPAAGRPRARRSQRFAARIEHEVAALADEATTDWYSARLRAHASASPALTGPDVGAWRRTWALGDRRKRAADAGPTALARPRLRPDGGARQESVRGQGWEPDGAVCGWSWRRRRGGASRPTC